MVYEHKLPQEVIEESSPRKITANVFGTFVVLVLANVAAWMYAQRVTMNHDVFMARSKWDLVRRAEPKADCMVIGDSSGNFGVVPEVLDAELGWTTRNVCTMGRYLSMGDVWMLRESIRLHGPPKRVISMHAVRRWEETLEPASMAQVPLPWGFWKEEPALDLSWRDERDLFLARYVPLYASHLTFARAIKDGRWTLENPIEITQNGHSLLPNPNPFNVGRKTRQVLAQLAERKRLSLTPANVQALEALRDLAEEHQFDLYLAHGPVFEKLAEGRPYRRYLGYLNEYLEEFAAQSPRVQLLFSEPIRFKQQEMENPNHLVGDAANVFTRKLAEALRAAGAR